MISGLCMKVATNSAEQTASCIDAECWHWKYVAKLENGLILMEFVGILGCLICSQMPAGVQQQVPNSR